MKWYTEKGFSKIRINFEDLNHQNYCVHLFRLNNIAIHSLYESKHIGNFYIEGFVKDQSLARLEEYLIKGQDALKKQQA